MLSGYAKILFDRTRGKSVVVILGLNLLKMVFDSGSESNIFFHLLSIYHLSIMYLRIYQTL